MSPGFWSERWQGREEWGRHRAGEGQRSSLTWRCAALGMPPGRPSGEAKWVVGLAVYFRGEFRTGDLNLKCEAIKPHEIIKGGDHQGPRDYAPSALSTQM